MRTGSPELRRDGVARGVAYILIGRGKPSDRLRPVLINIPQALDRLCYRYPSMLVDTITEHEVGRRLVAFKNVTVNEEFFQGHFPGDPLMPGVLMLESLSQVAAILSAAARGRTAQCARLPARREPRQVPQAGGAR